MSLQDRFDRTTPQFQERIRYLATRAGLNALDVYAMWHEYADQCRAYDQSALLSEFEDWYRDKLAPVAEA